MPDADFRKLALLLRVQRRSLPRSIAKTVITVAAAWGQAIAWLQIKPAPWATGFLS